MVASRDRARIIARASLTGKYETLWEAEASAIQTKGAPPCADADQSTATKGDVAVGVLKLATESPRWHKSRFGWLVAKKLNEACARNAFDGLVVVAPRRMRRNIHEGLDPATAARIVAELSKNLTRLHDSELAEQFAMLQVPITDHEKRGSLSNGE